MNSIITNILLNDAAAHAAWVLPEILATIILVILGLLTTITFVYSIVEGELAGMGFGLILALACAGMLSLIYDEHHFNKEAIIQKAQYIEAWSKDKESTASFKTYSDGDGYVLLNYKTYTTITINSNAKQASETHTIPVRKKQMDEIEEATKNTPMRLSTAISKRQLRLTKWKNPTQETP